MYNWVFSLECVATCGFCSVLSKCIKSWNNDQEIKSWSLKTRQRIITVNGLAQWTAKHRDNLSSLKTFSK